MKKIALIFGVGLVTLVSCPQPSPPDTSIKTLSGTVIEDATLIGSPNPGTKAWTGGAGSVMASGLSQGGESVKLGDLQASGAFTLNLPESVDAALLSTYRINDQLPTQCTQNATISDPAAKGTQIVPTVTNKEGLTMPIVPVTAERTYDTVTKSGQITLQIGSLLYADRPFKISGTQTCTFENMLYNTNVDLSFSRGWNLITTKQVREITNGEETKATYTLISGNLPTNNWLFGASPFMPMSKAASILAR